MKLLKYIFLFIFSLLLYSNVSATEIVVVDNHNVFFEVGHTQTNSKEETWLGLLYLQENSKLATSNDKIGLSCQQSSSSAHRDLIDAWEVLHDAGVDDLVRKNIDEVDFVDDFIKTNPNKTKAQVTSDINSQGYSAWKLANGVGKFTTAELALLKRADLPNFVSNNLDDLLLAENRTAIWNLNNVSSGQFKRGDLIEEIFNQWGNKYGGYQNLNDIIPNYRTLDFDGVLANVNEVVSLKTFKPITNNTLSNFKTTLRNNTRKLNNDAAIGVNHTGKDRVLDFTVENGAWTTNQLDDIDTYIDGLLNDFPNVTDIRISEF